MKVYIKLLDQISFLILSIFTGKKQDERPMVLDVLLQAQKESLDDYHLASSQ